MKVVCMIPARLGSQRLKKKNLKTINGLSLIGHAIRKSFDSKSFDSVWVNSESEEIGRIAQEEGINFYKRSSELANNSATSEDFIYDFSKKHRMLDFVVQVHSIAPLLSVRDIREFVDKIKSGSADVYLSYEPIQIESSYQNNPVNFTLSEKTNSQELQPIQGVSWSLSWKEKRLIYMPIKLEIARLIAEI